MIWLWMPRNLFRWWRGACLEAEEEKDKQTRHWKKNKHVYTRVKIPPHGSASVRREKEVRHREVPCGVPEYRQPQPEAQANQRWP